MDPCSPHDELERYRNAFLRLKSVVHDRATGLSAYPFLFEQLRAMLDKRRHVGVLHVEVANLEQVEAIYGWQTFDRLLLRISRELSARIGREIPAGALLALDRVAGDRFLAFVPDGEEGREVDAALLEATGGRLRAALDTVLQEDEFESLTPRLSIRVGHALLSENPFYRFERRVHAAVAEARALHGRREMQRERVWGAELKRILREADVTTLFQPVVELASGRILGHEALARGPRHGLLEMPSTLFAMSSQAGVSPELDRVCRRAALREWGRSPLEGKVFLNALVPGLSDPDWREGGLNDLLAAAALGPPDVVVELSERDLDAGTIATQTAIESLREQGFGLAVDDVGTGYSSLATLERVMPDYLKMDVTLVRGVDGNFIKQELASSLVTIAGRMGAQVIAEGIESEPEAATLRAMGARYGQGFLFAGPAPPAAGSAREWKELPRS